jgi:hypothetical protein
MKHEQTSNARDPRRAAKTARNPRPLLLLVCGLCGVVLYFARAAFIPVALFVRER